MFPHRQFFPVASPDHLFSFSQEGNVAFDWNDLSNNSSHALLYMCKQNGISVEEPFLKRTMILLLREFIESKSNKQPIQLAPVKEHVSQLKTEYISATFKMPKRIDYAARSSTSSISSDTASTSSTTNSNQPYLPEETRKIEEKESLLQTVKLAFEKPRKFVSNILATPVEKQRNLFRYMMIALHIALFVLYLTNNNFKLQKSPRIIAK